MTQKSLDVFDSTVQTTYEWLRDVGRALGDDRRHLAYLALRGTLHALRDFLPLEESAQISAQLPMLVRGIYFEGWAPSKTPEKDRSRERFLGRVEAALERSMWNEPRPIDTEAAARAVLSVLTDRVSAGEMDQVRHVMPERVRELWPPASSADSASAG